MIKAVIFDFDGLLVDTEIISYYIYRDMLKKYGYSFSVKEYASDYSGKSEITNMNDLIETYSLPFDLNKGLRIEAETEEQYFSKGINLKNGVKELLYYLKEHRYKTAIATSSTKDRCLDLLKSHGIEGYFDVFVFTNEVKHGKPDPDIFLEASSRLDIIPEECLVLEDSEAGIEASSKAKIPVICIPDMKKPDPSFAYKTSAVLDDLNQVINYLEEQERCAF